MNHGVANFDPGGISVENNSAYFGPKNRNQIAELLQIFVRAMNGCRQMPLQISSGLQDLFLADVANQQRGRSKELRAEICAGKQRRYIGFERLHLSKESRVGRRRFALAQQGHACAALPLSRFLLVRGADSGGEQREFRRLRDLGLKVGKETPGGFDLGDKHQSGLRAELTSTQSK